MIYKSWINVRTLFSFPLNSSVTSSSSSSSTTATKRVQLRIQCCLRERRRSIHTLVEYNANGG
ncbi:hypothetical protein BLOT_006116 [Blomia tropicalis]|nr:hypothetical protein BLOT_006116 [Blomia tropicalis]